MTQQLQDKLNYSIQLLRRWEKLAMLYDPEEGFYLGFSGGKDSQALYHVAKMAGVKFKAHMAMTSVDPPAVVRFVKKNYPDVELIAPKESIYSVAMKKRVLPTRVMRWCCDVFKEGHGAGKVKLIGIRHEESVKRAKRNEMEVSSYKFSGTQEEFMEWQEDQRMKLYDSDIQDEDKVKCIGGKDSIIVSPIIEWTKADVWEFLNDVVKVPHCELYDTGHHRIGCIFCPMSSLKQLRQDEKEYPHQRHKWIETIKALRREGFMCNIDAIIDTSKYSEEEMAEHVYQWWLSKQNVRDYVGLHFLQQSINFDEI